MCALLETEPTGVQRAAEPGAAPARLALAYLIGRYPDVSHTFVAREVEALRARGVHVDTFSIWRTPEDELYSEQDRREYASTFAILPLRAAVLARAHLSALARRPGAYVAALRRAMALSRPGVRGRLLGLSWFAEAMILADQLRRRGLRHVHVHLNGTAPSVAAVATEFGNHGTDRAEWSWSLTLHGPSELFDIFGERLEEKVRSARFVICISDFARSQLMALVDESHWDKLRVVHCGVEPDVFDHEVRPAPPSGTLRVLTVARLTQVKGQAVLLRALAQLRDRGVHATATIVGGGPKQRDLERIAADLGVADRVTFTGAVGQDEIRGYFEAADVFCLSSFAEGVPVVLMEAMAMRLPVVAPQIMGIGELIEPGVSGLLVRAGRPDLFADALERLASDDALRRRLADEGREAVLREFDVRASGAQIDALLREMLAR